MWKRLKRAVSSNLERLRDDPLSPRDWRALSRDLATVRSQAALLERDLARLEAEEEALSESIRSALREGRRGEGLDLAESLSRVRRDKTKVTEQLAAARQVVAKAEALESLQAEGSPRRREPGEAERAGPEDALLRDRARDTVERLARDLEEGARPKGAGEGEREPGAPRRKTLGGGGGVGAESGPTPVARKTLGGAAPDEEEEAAPPSPGAAKTLGSRELGSGEGAGSGERDLLLELERLAKLKEQGILDEEEFAQAKRKLLDT